MRKRKYLQHDVTNDVLKHSLNMQKYIKYLIFININFRFNEEYFGEEKKEFVKVQIMVSLSKNVTQV